MATNKTAGKLEKDVIHSGRMTAQDGKIVLNEGEKGGPPANFSRPKATNVPAATSSKDQTKG